MKTLRSRKLDCRRWMLPWFAFLPAVLAPWAGTWTANAQGVVGNPTDAYSIMTFNDGASCDPENGHAHAKDLAGCCGSPGQRVCFGGVITLGFSVACTNPSDNLSRIDQFGGGVWCNLPDPSCDTSLSNMISAPGNPNQDFTFYVTSDLHFFRQTYVVTDQIKHVANLNSFAVGLHTWPRAGGLPIGPMQVPRAVIIAGDITTGGWRDNLGSFRLVWEHDTLDNNQSINYPVFFGLGNHDFSQVDSTNDADRMDNYIRNRMCKVNLDVNSNGNGGPDNGGGSLNYSWDYQGVHFIQLNTWAGDQQSGGSHPTSSNGIGWLARDLNVNVGHTGRPVVLIQHYPMSSISGITGNCSGTNIPGKTDNCWWTSDNYTAFWNTIRDYNVIAMFAGHTHSLYMDTNTSLGIASTNSHSDTNRIDEFVDGSGGSCPDGKSGCTAGVGNFLVTHVVNDPVNAYLDVAAYSWAAALNGGQPIEDRYQEGTAQYPGYDLTNSVPVPAASGATKANLFFGGTAACRKRINTRYIAVPAAAATITEGASQGGGLAQSVKVVNTSTSTIPGPLALKISGIANTSSTTQTCTTSLDSSTASPEGGLCNITNRDFVDSCSPTEGSAYLLINGGNDLSPAASASVSVNLSDANTTFSTSLVRLAPLGVQLTPALQSFDVVSAWGTNTAVTVPPTQTIKVAGPPNQQFHTTVIYSGAASGWLQVAGSGSTDQYGFGSFTYSFSQPQLASILIGVVTGEVTVSFASTGEQATLTTSLTFRAPVTVTTTVTPASYVPQGTTPVITASFGYNHNIPNGPAEGGNRVLGGTVTVRNAIPSATGYTTSAPLATAFVNTAADCTQNGNTFPVDTVIFGDPAYGCSPTINLNARGVWSLAVFYEGSGVGDSAFAASNSRPFQYVVYGVPAHVSLVSGPNQSAPPNSSFPLPISLFVQDSNFAPLQYVPVTFQVVPGAGGASGTLGGATKVTIYSDVSGLVSVPVITANSFSGTWTVVASVASVTNPINIQLQNQIGGVPFIPPTLTAVVSQKSGTLTNRKWTVEFVNTGAPASNLTVTSISFKQESGAACATPVASFGGTNVVGNDIGSASIPININFGRCAAAARFTVTFGVTANQGAYKASLVAGHQYP